MILLKGNLFQMSFLKGEISKFQSGFIISVKSLFSLLVSIISAFLWILIAREKGC